MKLTDAVNGALNRDNIGSNAGPVRTPTTTGIGAMRAIIDERYKKELLKNVGRFKGIVLWVKDMVVEGGNDPVRSPTRDSKDLVHGQSAKVHHQIIKVLVPEVDPRPIPKSIPDEHGRGGDLTAISVFPDFEAAESWKDPPPKPGDIVWVDYRNRKDFTGGIYLSPFLAGAVEPGVKRGGLREFKKLECSFCAQGPWGEALGVETIQHHAEQANLVPVVLDISGSKGALPAGKGIFTGIDTPTLKTHPLSAMQDAKLSWICFRGVDIPDYHKDNNRSVSVMAPVDRAAQKAVTATNVGKWIKKYHQNGVRTYMMVRSPNLILTQKMSIKEWNALIDEYASTIIARAKAYDTKAKAGDTKTGVIGIVVEMTTHSPTTKYVEGWVENDSVYGCNQATGAGCIERATNAEFPAHAIGGPPKWFMKGELQDGIGDVWAMTDSDAVTLTDFWQKIHGAAKAAGLSIGISVAEFGFPDKAIPSGPNQPKPLLQGISGIEKIPWAMLATGPLAADFVIHKFSGHPELYGELENAATWNPETGFWVGSDWESEQAACAEDETGETIDPEACESYTAASEAWQDQVALFPAPVHQANILKTLGFKYIIPGLSTGFAPGTRFSPQPIKPEIGDVRPAGMRQMAGAIFSNDAYGDGASSEGGAMATLWGPWPKSDENDSSIVGGPTSSRVYSDEKDKYERIPWAEKRWSVLKELGDLAVRYEHLNNVDSTTGRMARASEYDKNIIKMFGVEQYLTGIVTEYKRFLRVEADHANYFRGVTKTNIFLPPGANEGWGRTGPDFWRILGLKPKIYNKTGEWDIPMPFTPKSDGTGYWTARELKNATNGFLTAAGATDEARAAEVEFWEAHPPPEHVTVPPSETPVTTEVVQEQIKTAQEQIVQENKDRILELCKQYAAAAEGGA